MDIACGHQILTPGSALGALGAPGGHGAPGALCAPGAVPWEAIGWT